MDKLITTVLHPPPQYYVYIIVLKQIQKVGPQRVRKTKPRLTQYMYRRSLDHNNCKLRFFNINSLVQLRMAADFNPGTCRTYANG